MYQLILFFSVSVTATVNFASAWDSRQHNTSVFSLVPRLSTRHCPHLLLSTVLRQRRCCWASAAVDRYLLPAGRPAANLSHAAATVDRNRPWHSIRDRIDGTDGRTDGRRTPDRYIDSAPHTIRTVSVARDRISLTDHVTRRWRHFRHWVQETSGAHAPPREGAGLWEFVGGKGREKGGDCLLFRPI